MIREVFLSFTVRWSETRFGSGSIILGGDDLLIQSEKGALVRVAASPDGFRARQRAAILGAEVRAHSALAAGLYLARDKVKLVCIHLRK